MARRPSDHLSQIGDPHCDVSADEIRIPPFEIVGRHDVPGENPLAKTWREALDLLFDPGEHVDG